MIAFAPTPWLAAAGPLDWHGWGPFFWTALTFILVFLALRKWAWGPLQEALGDREARLRETIEAAERTRAEAEERLAEYEAQLDEAREEALAIIEEGKEDAEKVRQRIVQEANDEKTRILKRTKRELGLARDKALDEVTRRSVEVGMLVARRVLEREISADDHEELIDEAVTAFRERAEEAELLGGPS